MARKKTFIEVRKEQKVSQMLLSKRTKIKRYRIAEVENGYRCFTDTEKMTLAKTLGVKVRGVLWTPVDRLATGS